jgi:hypothetical protein
MEKSTRLRLAVGAAVCGVSAAIGWAVAIYAYSNTPEIHEVVVRAANGGQSIHSKTAFLFAPAVFPIFFCLMILNPLIRWKKVIRKAIERAAPKDLWTEPTIGRFRFATVLSGVNIGLCIFSVAVLYKIIERAEYLLSK